MPRHRTDEIGQWSEDKLNLLAKYLHSYTVIMSRQLVGTTNRQGRSGWCSGYYYIDAFAGKGRWIRRGEGNYVDGSPRVALSTTPSFSGYYFIDLDRGRVEELDALNQEFADKQITVLYGDANEVIRKTVLPEVNSKSKRGVVFLDPYGVDLRWETVQAIAATGVLEVIINFPISVSNRGFIWDDPDKIGQKQIDRFNAFWGSPSWRDIAYVEDSSFGVTWLKRLPKAGEQLSAVFTQRLEQVFGYATDPLMMKNSKNSVLYCLIFAGPNPTGKKIAQDVFDKYFEDNNPQMSLF